MGRCTTSLLARLWFDGYMLDKAHNALVNGQASHIDNEEMEILIAYRGYSNSGTAQFSNKIKIPRAQSSSINKQSMEPYSICFSCLQADIYLAFEFC
jgi:hypothetical protein